MDVSDFEAAGLYDPNAPNAAARLELLRWLAAQGVTLEQMSDSMRFGSLVSLAGDLALRAGIHLTLEQVAARLQVDPAKLEAVYLASGLRPPEPDEPVFSAEDIAGFGAFLRGAELFGDEATLQFARVVGSSTASMAEAAVALFLVNIEQPMIDAGRDESALARANLESVQALGAIPIAIRGILRAHLEAAMRRFRRSRGTGVADVVGLAVGFVDLVGYTRLSQRRTPHELAALVEEFERLAHEVAVARDGRIVKVVGDAVMFVTDDPAAACDIALTLLDRFTDNNTITPRGGIAFGQILMRGGDYHGPMVNLAARLADLAVPREVLVTPDVADRATGAEHLRFEPAGRRLLKGFDDPVRVLSVVRKP